MVSLSEIGNENLDSLHENAVVDTLRITTNMPLSVFPVKHERRLSLYKFGTSGRRLSNFCAVQSTAISGKEYWSLSDMVKKGRIK
jgi:hypothetical protein